MLSVYLQSFKNHGFSILGLSAAVTVFTLPLYLAAEKWQRIERDTQYKMGNYIKKIKSVFIGDERYLILSTYYRQNHYHPIYAMRSSFGILFQIPFFIAAYSFLANFEILKGTPFLFINDLGSPDTLIFYNGFSLNILPITMTLLNVFSGIIYSKGFLLRDKLQFYGTAAIFLILLYNSPSGLTLYWTMNNLFSLIKNILLKLKNPKKIIYGFLCLFDIFFIIFIIFLHKGYYLKRIFVVILASFIFFIPLLDILFRKIIQRIGKFLKTSNCLLHKRTFYLSLINIFLLAGIVIPSTLIASSTQEFSYIESFKSPFPFIFTSIYQAFGIFIFWPSCIFFLCSSHNKKYITYFSFLFLIIFCINNFIFSGNYGFITANLILSNPGTFFTNMPFVVTNIICLLFALVLFSLLIFSRFQKFFLSFLSILLVTFIGMSVFNLSKIKMEFDVLKNNISQDKKDNYELIKPLFHFSREGKNVFVIMLDRAISAFIPFIFNEKPELTKSFTGFTYYPNTVSFGSSTIFGAPPLFAGYEYTPFEIQKRNAELLVDKYNESLLVLPKIFLNQQFQVTITDPPYANFSWKPDLSIYSSLLNGGCELHIENLSGKYSAQWFQKNPEVQVISISNVLQKNLIWFSFFKIAPPSIRTFIFDHGRWLSAYAIADDMSKNKKLTISTINDYAILDFLPDLTDIIDKGNTFSIMCNLLTHEPTYFQAPDYHPVLNVTDIGNGPYSAIPEYHANTAALLLLKKWFDYLQNNNVYNNSRIIIVSDHGSDFDDNFPYNIKLPNGQNLEIYNALLMVKDFDAHGDLQTNDSFMSNADVPYLAYHDLFQTPKNPYTSRIMESKKSDRLMITTNNIRFPRSHNKNTFKIENNEWLSVYNNIFNPENWQQETVVNP